jgi:predicted Abi (CAAX) family protease
MSCLVVILALAVFAALGYWIGVIQWGTPSAGIGSAVGSMLAALLIVYLLVNLRD